MTAPEAARALADELHEAATERELGGDTGRAYELRGLALTVARAPHDWIIEKAAEELAAELHDTGGWTA